MKTFEELGVREDLLKAIDEMGFVMPMPIQELVIPHLLTSDNDVVALAQTGTGKTAAYGLPVIQRTDTKINRPQVLILAPTRELCLQIGSDLADFSKYVENLSILPVYGGSSIESQIRSLKKGVQIIVATPGRLIDLINRNTVSLDGVHTVILDEADEMLNMGFVESIEEILTNVPYDRKMLMFSATMPTEIAKIAKKYMHNPEEYVVGTRNEGAENVRHVYFMVHARDKYKALKRVADWLIQDGYNADSLHGDLSQAQRDMVMKKFRERNLQLLVATDVAARGLDVTDLTHVINYGLPDDIATYTHRSGRTGRAGKTGVSVSIVHSKEKGKIRDIEKRIGKKFEYMEVPKPVQIIEKQLYNLADRIEKVDVDDEEIGKYLPGVLKKLSWLDGEDLLKRVLSLEFNRLLEYYKGAPVLDVVTERGKKAEKKDRPARTAEEKDRRVAEKGYERVYINLGKADGFYAQNLIELINKNVDGQRVDIGRIDLLSGYSLFDVRQGDAQRVVGSVKNSDFYGKRVYCEIAKADKDYAAENVGKGGKRRSRGEELRKRVSSDDFATNRRSRRERRGGKDGKAEKPEKKMHGNYDKFIKKDK